MPIAKATRLYRTNAPVTVELDYGPMATIPEGRMLWLYCTRKMPTGEHIGTFCETYHWRFSGYSPTGVLFTLNMDQVTQVH